MHTKLVLYCCIKINEPNDRYFWYFTQYMIFTKIQHQNIFLCNLFLLFVLPSLSFFLSISLYFWFSCTTRIFHTKQSLNKDTLYKEKESFNSWKTNARILWTLNSRNWLWEKFYFSLLNTFIFIVHTFFMALFVMVE